MMCAPTKAWLFAANTGLGAHTSGPILCAGDLLNYYRRFPGDYAKDTGHLTLAEHGVYALLLDHLYATEKPILSIEQAMRICKVGRSFKPIRKSFEQRLVESVLSEFFKKTDDGYIHKRVEEEIKYVSSKSCAAREAAKARWSKDANALQTHSERNALPDSRLQTPENTNTESIYIPRSWPENFTLLTSMKEAALAEGVPDPEREFEAWRADCLAHGREYLNWMQAWKGRIMRYQKFNKGAANGTRSTESFGERQRRKSEDALRSFGGNLEAMVHQVERRLPDTRNNTNPNPDLPRSAGRLEPERAKPSVPGSDKNSGSVPEARTHSEGTGSIASGRVRSAQPPRVS